MGVTLSGLFLRKYTAQSITGASMAFSTTLKLEGKTNGAMWKVSPRRALFYSVQCYIEAFVEKYTVYLASFTCLHSKWVLNKALINSFSTLVVFSFMPYKQKQTPQRPNYEFFTCENKYILLTMHSLGGSGLALTFHPLRSPFSCPCLLLYVYNLSGVCM